MPGTRSGRVLCERCGEGINFRREVKTNGGILCIPCATGNYIAKNGKEPTAPHPKIVLVVGGKKTGKTTLIEKLIPELAARGYRVGTIKHHHSSSHMNLDQEGKDSWRHRRAGAKAVALVSPIEIATFQSLSGSVSLDEAILCLKDVDVILVEGFHSETRAKIVVCKSNQDALGWDGDEHLLALVSPEKGDGRIPCFAPEEIKPLADLIEEWRT